MQWLIISRMPPNRSRELLIKVLLAGMGVVFTLVALEVLARIFMPAAGSVAYVPDPQVGYRHAPGQDLLVSDGTGEYSARFTTNSHGDPDRERALAKPAGVYRIAVIGDSMVEAAQVPLEERFTYLLEEDLTAWARHEDAVPFDRVEVLNFGTAGYSTAQELLYYREHVRQFDPDLVVLVFLPGNDVKNNSYELEVVQSCRSEIAPFFTLSDDAELVVVNQNYYELAQERYQEVDLTLAGKVREYLLGTFRLADLGYRAYTALNSGTALTGKAAQLDQDACQTETTLELYDPAVQQSSPDWQTAWRLTEAIVRRFNQETSAQGTDFHVVSVTGPWEVQPETRSLVLEPSEQGHYDWDLAQRMTSDMAQRLEIDIQQVLEAMRRAVQAGTNVHYDFNGHYTPAGHRILAQELLPVLQAYLLK